VYDDGSYEVGMGFYSFYFFHCVVVEDSQLKIIRPTYDPIFLRDELDGSDGEGGCFKSSYAGLG
jgi:hypothetical protein